MSHSNMTPCAAGAPVFDFLSGNVNTTAAKRMTKKIRTVRSLWLLAKMAGDAKR